MVRTGLERVAAGEVGALRGKRVALLAHPASVTREFVHAVDVLMHVGASVVRLLGPEHGFGGEAQDMEHVGASRFAGFGSKNNGDAGIPVVSLYGASLGTLTPKPEVLADVDALVIDLQDVGSRYYTFVWTMALALKVASSLGVHTYVLDRPNPLGGTVVEGAPQHTEFLSFVGLYALPIRHGLTIGEIACWVARQDNIGRDAFSVVEMQGWQRSMLFPETGLPWIYPSPNMPTFDTALVYPGGCLIEGTTLSEGRGTTRPFEQIGAPHLDTNRLVRAMSADAHPGAHLRASTFTPTFHKHRNTLCNASFTHVVDSRTFRSVELYATWLAWAWQQRSCDQFWRTEAYEYESTRLAIDLLAGDSSLRKAIETGADAVSQWCQEGQKRAEYSARELQVHHLY